MINAVGRDIPEEILKATGKKYFREIIISMDMFSRDMAQTQDA